jgi:prepilin-type N-terminal cleavage/methylation domain-containing protein
MKKIAQNKNIKIKSARGFTLIEMLVATAVFMSVMTVAVSALITIINADKQSQNIKTTTDAVTFAIDTMSRDMRVGTNYECMISSGAGKFAPYTDQNSGKSTLDCTAGSNAVGYINNSNPNQGIVYTFTPPTSANLSGELAELTCDTDFKNCSSEDLISSDSGANISNVTFYVIGADGASLPGLARTQPRVIITASGVIPETTSTTTTEFDLQTNIDERSRISQ